MFRHPICAGPDCSSKIHFLSYKNNLIQAVRLARTRIWIMAFVVNCNLNKQSDPVTLFFSLLRKRLQHGVDIRFILDSPAINRPNYHCNKFIIRWLEEWNIPYCTPPQKVTAHAKAVLIDNNCLFIGSHNLAKSSLENPLECTAEIRDELLIAEFAAAYEVIWDDVGMVSHKPPYRQDPSAPRPWMEHKNGNCS